MKYTKPNIEIITTNTQLLITNSFIKECSCETKVYYGGCQGCKGNCGCNYWDGEKIIPGC